MTPEREQLFLTGILPDEALAFARWLGPGFDLPTVDEWRRAYDALDGVRLSWDDLAGPLAQGAAEPARLILKQLFGRPGSVAAQDATLMRGGVIEWALAGRRWVGKGAPRPAFFPSILDPRHDAFTPIHPDERLRYLGFRLIRRGRG